MSVAIRIVRLDPSISLPEYATPDAAGFDLAASVDMSIAPGEVALVPTGLVIEVPPGHFLGDFRAEQHAVEARSHGRQRRRRR